MTTMMESPIQVPGSFLPDSDFPFHCARFKSSVFLPPLDDTPRSSSPSSPATQAQSFSTPPVAADDSPQYSRKRLRLDIGGAQDDSYTTSWKSNREAFSPPPLVSTTYRIAGGLDTPTALNVQREEDAHEYDYEIDCRPNRCSQKSSQPSESYFPQTPCSNEHGRNKRRLSRSSKGGWGKAVWALTGDIAGKVFNFCWNTTFKGFHAGGGNGYRFDVGTPDVTSSNAWTGVDTKEDVFHTDYHVPSRRGREGTPVPGGFPEEQPEYVEDYITKPYAYQKNESTPTTTFDNGSSSTLRHSWVVVDGSNTTSREASPVRKKSRASTANLYARQTATARHSNTQSRTRLTPRSSTGRSSASYASPRASPNPNLSTQHHAHHSLSKPTPNPFHSDKPTYHRYPRHSVSSQTHKHTKRPSLSSPRRQSTQNQSPSATNPSPEVRKFEQKLRRKEAKQDETMNRFNAHLQAMIQEGQRALESKIEVEMDGEDDAEVDVDDGYDEIERVERWEREKGYETSGPGRWA